MKRLLLSLTLLLLFGFAGACTSTPSAREVAGPVLGRINDYEAPPYPEETLMKQETYDDLVEAGDPVPPTPIDTLVADCFAIRKAREDVETIGQVIERYRTAPWHKLIGYRPWTHSNFVQSLSDPEREALIYEIQEYEKKRGVWEAPR